MSVKAESLLIGVLAVVLNGCVPTIFTNHFDTIQSARIAKTPDRCLVPPFLPDSTRDITFQQDRHTCITRGSFAFSKHDYTKLISRLKPASSDDAQAFAGSLPSKDYLFFTFPPPEYDGFWVVAINPKKCNGYYILEPTF